jgi:hypothetical protein
VKEPAFPTYFPEECGEAVEEDTYEDSIHHFSNPSITFDENR